MDGGFLGIPQTMAATGRRLGSFPGSFDRVTRLSVGLFAITFNLIFCAVANYGWILVGKHRVLPLALLTQIIRQAHFPHHNDSKKFGFVASHPGVYRGCFISHPANTK